MIHHSHRLIGAALLAFSSAAWVGPAQAQGNPSADQIINSLRPGGGMLGGTRGIRPVAPSAEPAAPAPVTPSQPRASQTARAAEARPRAVPGPAPVRTASAPSVNLTVQFATNLRRLDASRGQNAVRTRTGAVERHPRELPFPDRGTYRHGRRGGYEQGLVRPARPGRGRVSLQQFQNRPEPPGSGWDGRRWAADPNAT